MCDRPCRYPSVGPVAHGPKPILESRKLPKADRLSEGIIELARELGRYGYSMIIGMLNKGGWHVNHKRVERIWRREGLKVP